MNESSNITTNKSDSSQLGSFQVDVFGDENTKMSPKSGDQPNAQEDVQGSELENDVETITTSETPGAETNAKGVIPDQTETDLPMSSGTARDVAESDTVKMPSTVENAAASASASTPLLSNSNLGQQLTDDEKDIFYQKIIHDQEDEISNLKSQVRSLQQQIEESNSKIAELGTIFTTLEKHIEKTELENLNLKSDNDTLRTYIANSKTAPSPTHVESYYVERLDQLNQFISSKVADLCKASASKTYRISEQAGNGVLDALAEREPYGKRASVVLSRGLIWSLHNDPRRRIAVMRHIIAFFLWTHVFGGYAFSLDVGISDALFQIEDNICSTETDFSKVLTIRQAIGRAVMDQLVNTRDVRKYKAEFIEALSRVLALLLPSSIGIQAMVVKIADMAVNVANDMTAEQAIYRCEFVESGNDPKLAAVDVADSKQRGRVYLCTFPAFLKVFKNDDAVEWTPLVKASAELQSAFG